MITVFVLNCFVVFWCYVCRTSFTAYKRYHAVSYTVQTVFDSKPIIIGRNLVFTDVPGKKGFSLCLGWTMIGPGRRYCYYRCAWAIWTVRKCMMYNISNMNTNLPWHWSLRSLGFWDFLPPMVQESYVYLSSAHRRRNVSSVVGLNCKCVVTAMPAISVFRQRPQWAGGFSSVRKSKIHHTLLRPSGHVDSFLKCPLLVLHAEHVLKPHLHNVTTKYYK